MKEYLKIKRKQQGDPLQVCDYTNEDGSILPVLKFQELSDLDFIEHCFSMRQGGVSEGYQASLNLTYSRGDDPQNVRKNYERLTKVFHGTPEQLFMTRFEHGTTVVRVDKAGQDPGDLRYDGMITNVPGVILGALVADCMPVIRRSRPEGNRTVPLRLARYTGAYFPGNSGKDAQGIRV